MNIQENDLIIVNIDDLSTEIRLVDGVWLWNNNNYCKIIAINYLINRRSFLIQN